MHSLVGLAAVFVGFNADIEITNVKTALAGGGDLKSLTGFAALVAKKTAVEINILRVELFLGIFIGAITFTGSVVAYGKLAGRFNTTATQLPAVMCSTRLRRSCLWFRCCGISNRVICCRC